MAGQYGSDEESTRHQRPVPGPVVAPWWFWQDTHWHRNWRPKMSPDWPWRQWRGHHFPKVERPDPSHLLTSRKGNKSARLANHHPPEQLFPPSIVDPLQLHDLELSDHDCTHDNPSHLTTNHHATVRPHYRKQTHRPRATECHHPDNLDVLCHGERREMPF